MIKVTKHTQKILLLKFLIHSFHLLAWLKPSVCCKRESRIRNCSSITPAIFPPFQRPAKIATCDRKISKIIHVWRGGGQTWDKFLHPLWYLGILIPFLFQDPLEIQWTIPHRKSHDTWEFWGYSEFRWSKF